jgi:hypothetical protein
VIETQAQVDVDYFEGRRPRAETLGCYKHGSHTTYSVPDPYVLAHEFKHYFDGDFHERP